MKQCNLSPTRKTECRQGKNHAIKWFYLNFQKDVDTNPQRSYPLQFVFHFLSFLEHGHEFHEFLFRFLSLTLGGHFANLYLIKE